MAVIRSRWVNSIAELRTLTPPGEPNFPIAVLGYYTAGDGGGDVFAYSLTSSAADDAGITVRPDSVGPTEQGRWLRVVEEYTPRMFGAMCDGVADDTLTFNAARAAAIGHTLHIDGVLLISSALTITVKEHWVFAGALAIGTAALPGSYLLKAASLNADLVTIQGGAADGTIIENGGIVGQFGNGGDGFVIQANSVVLRDVFVRAMGHDGIRCGRDAEGFNANRFLLDRVVCHANLNRGIYVNDDNSAVSVDANAGEIFAPKCLGNASDGIHIHHAYWITISNPGCEVNDEHGIFINSAAVMTIVRGGDCEGNTSGDIRITGTDTVIDHVNTLAPIINAGTRTKIYGFQAPFTPVLLFGGAAVGMTYSLRYGAVTREGDMYHARMTLVLSAKGSSTGAATITGLPAAANIGFNAGVSFGNATNMQTLTGALVGQVLTNSGTIRLGQLGATGQSPLDEGDFTDTTDLEISVSYPAP